MIEKVKQLLKPDASVGAKLTVVSLFFGKMFEKHDSRIEVLEERQLQKGDKGDKGDTGERGIAGKDGKDGIGRDGKDGIGRDGKDGAAGKPGAKGADGVSVKDVTIAADNHLVVTLSNGNEIDAGDLDVVIGRSQHIISTQVARDQITVSATAPENPYLHQLWYDIS